MRATRLITALAASALSSVAMAASLSPDAVLGTWWCSSLITDCGPATITLLPNGKYFQQTFGIPDGDGQPGIERGTYTFVPNQTTSDLGTISFATSLDTNGGWGVNSATLPIRITSTEIDVLAGNMPVLYRIAGPTKIQNGWIRTEPSGSMSLLAFMPNGEFLYSIESPQPMVEYGNYSWNSVSGALEISSAHKSGTGTSLANLTNLHIFVTGPQINMISDQTQSYFSAAPISSIPEPKISIMILVGMLIILAFGRRIQAGTPNSV